MKQKSRLGVVLLVMVLVVSSFSTMGIKAKSYAKLYESNIKLAVEGQYTLDIYYREAKAKYTYTSSSKKIATVTSKGEIIGRKPGTAYITVKEILKGKKRKVGTCKVVVKKACFQNNKSEQEIVSKTYGNYKKFPYDLNWNEYYSLENEFSKWYTDNVRYRNKKAIYRFASTTKKVKINSAGEVVKFDLLHGQKAKINVVEIYKKRTTVIGCFYLVAKDVRLDKEYKTKKATTYTCTVGKKQDEYDIYSDGLYEIKYLASELKVIWNDQKNYVLTDKKLKKMGKKYNDSKFSMQYKVYKGQDYEWLVPKKAGVTYVHYFVRNYTTNKWERIVTRTFNVREAKKSVTV